MHVLNFARHHSAAKHGSEPSSRHVDELLDERAKLTGSSPPSHRPRDYCLDLSNSWVCQFAMTPVAWKMTRRPISTAWSANRS
jgi:hypothetical protein